MPYSPFPVADAKFITPLKDQRVPEGDTATFQCESSRDDTPVKWFRGTKEIVPDEKYEIVSEGKVHKLIVKDCKVADMSQFTCKLPKEKTTAKLTVDGMYVVQNLQKVPLNTRDLSQAFRCLLRFILLFVTVRLLIDTHKPLLSTETLKGHGKNNFYHVGWDTILPGDIIITPGKLLSCPAI